MTSSSKDHVGAPVSGASFREKTAQLPWELVEVNSRAVDVRIFVNAQPGQANGFAIQITEIVPDSVRRSS